MITALDQFRMIIQNMDGYYPVYEYPSFVTMKKNGIQSGYLKREELLFLLQEFDASQAVIVEDDGLESGC